MTRSRAAKPASSSSERPILAIASRLLAAIALMAMFSLSKLLQDRGVSLVETVSYRQLTALPIIAVWIVAVHGPSGFRPQRIGGHVSRTAVGLLSMVLNFGSYALLPLAEATTIGFSAPIFGTILSAVLLKEAVGWHRWSAVIIGFVGVILIVGPASAHLPVAGLTVAFGAAVGVASVSILVRQLARQETAAAIVFWFTLLSTPPALLGLALFGTGHDLVTFLLIGCMGLAGGIAQLLMTVSLKWGSIAVVMPMDYTSILWATLAGWLFWGTLPLLTTWIGGAVIIGSGLYIVWREHMRGVRARAEAAGSLAA